MCWKLLRQILDSRDERTGSLVDKEGQEVTGPRGHGIQGGAVKT